MLKFYDPALADTPLEMHKVKIVQALRYPELSERRAALIEAGANSYKMKNEHIFLDMLTDSGVNAMSDEQNAAMLRADESYSGSRTYFRLQAKCRELFGFDELIPVHQGRAAEHVLSRVLVRPGDIVPMNYMFGTTKNHIEKQGGEIRIFALDEAFNTKSLCPFKGDIDIAALQAHFQSGAKTAFVRMEAGTNLIGGQPFSLENARAATALCRSFGALAVLDASLLADELHFLKVRQKECASMTVRAITRELCDMFDIMYFSARKLGCVRGGGILARDAALAHSFRDVVAQYEGFPTYGGMSVREMEALTVGLDETMDEGMICQGPIFIDFLCQELKKRGVPVVEPSGGLGAHIDARRFLPHVNIEEYPAAALTAAIYLAGGIRGMESGTLSERRDYSDASRVSPLELVRLAMPRRVFTMSQALFVADRVAHLYRHRGRIGGMRLRNVEKPTCFFSDELEDIGGWYDRLMEIL